MNDEYPPAHPSCLGGKKKMNLGLSVGLWLTCC